MSDHSTIEWTDATWNPVTGCTKFSPGCDHCYAERVTNRFQGPGAFDTVVLHPDRLDQPLRWRKPRKVFVNSMSDLFHEAVPDEFIADVFAVMAQARQHTFQILTKRHARMRSWLRRCGDWEGWITHNGAPPEKAYDGDGIIVGYRSKGWPLPNVWLGVSVENQQWADIRVPALLDTPAAVRFLSCEPLLGPVDLSRWLDRCPSCGHRAHRQPCLNMASGNDCLCTCWRSLDWVIVGGESGPGARPMHPDWARAVREECAAAGAPFLFKQHGEWAPEAGLNWHEGNGRRLHYRREFVLPNGTFAGPWRSGGTLMERVGKRKAGRELDGRTWDEFPEVVQPV